MEDQIYILPRSLLQCSKVSVTDSGMCHHAVLAGHQVCICCGRVFYLCSPGPVGHRHQEALVGLVAFPIGSNSNFAPVPSAAVLSSGLSWRPCELLKLRPVRVLRLFIVLGTGVVLCVGRCQQSADAADSNEAFVPSKTCVL